MHILHSTVLQLWLVPGRKRGGIQRRKVRSAQTARQCRCDWCLQRHLTGEHAPVKLGTPCVDVGGWAKHGLMGQGHENQRVSVIHV